MIEIFSQQAKSYRKNFKLAKPAKKHHKHKLCTAMRRKRSTPDKRSEQSLRSKLFSKDDVLVLF